MTFDALGRRSRFKRTPTGKRVVLGERDIALLRALHRYRYLYQHQLIALIQPKSDKRFVERLGDLFHEAGLIDRVWIQMNPYAMHCAPMLYSLTPSGVRCLESIGAVPERAVTFSLRTSRAANPQLLHKLMIVDCLVDIELECRRLPERRFVPVDEIVARSPMETQRAPNPLRVPVTLRPSKDYPLIRSRREAHIIPDALYGIEYRVEGAKRYRFWALECERTSPAKRSTARASSTLLKRAAYDALITSGAFKRQWGIANLKLHLVKASDLVAEKNMVLPHSPKSKTAAG